MNAFGEELVDRIKLHQARKQAQRLYERKRYREDEGHREEHRFWWREWNRRRRGVQIVDPAGKVE